MGYREKVKEEKGGQEKTVVAVKFIRLCVSIRVIPQVQVRRRLPYCLLN